MFSTHLSLSQLPCALLQEFYLHSLAQLLSGLYMLLMHARYEIDHGYMLKFAKKYNDLCFMFIFSACQNVVCCLVVLLHSFDRFSSVCAGKESDQQGWRDRDFFYKD